MNIWHGTAVFILQIIVLLFQIYVVIKQKNGYLEFEKLIEANNPEEIKKLFTTIKTFFKL